MNESLIISGAAALNTAPGEHRNLPDGTPVKRFRRYIARIGATYRKPSWRSPLRITDERAQHWLSTWAEMKTNGVPVKVTKDHEDRRLAQSAMGDVVDIVRAKVGDAEWIATDLDVRGTENIKTAEANKDVSMEVEPSVADGEGRAYRDAIAAVTFTTHPVVVGQPIAASMDETSANETYYLSTEPDMLPILAAIAKLTGEAQVTEDNALAVLDKHAESFNQLKLSLETAHGEVKKLSTAAEVDTKYLSLSAKLDMQSLDHAVALGDITTACRDELKTLFVGDIEAAKFAPLKLSMGDESTGVLSRLLGAIKANRPVATGEHRPAAREVPDNIPAKAKTVKSGWTGAEIPVP